MITREQSKALRKAGLAGVCEVIGFGYKWGDGRELSPEDLARVQAVCSGQLSSPFIGKGRTVAPSKPKKKETKKGK